MAHVRAGIIVYLEQLAAATLEASRDLRLLSTFLRLVALVPSSIAHLMGATLPMQRIFVLRPRGLVCPSPAVEVDEKAPPVRFCGDCIRDGDARERIYFF